MLSLSLSLSLYLQTILNALSYRSLILLIQFSAVAHPNQLVVAKLLCCKHFHYFSNFLLRKIIRDSRKGMSVITKFFTYYIKMWLKKNFLSTASLQMRLPLTFFLVHHPISTSFCDFSAIGFRQLSHWQMVKDQVFQVFSDVIYILIKNCIFWIIG